MLHTRTIGEKIKHFRKIAGFTSQESLAMAMQDMNRSNIAQYENGNRLPGLSFVHQFCELCAISKDELLSNEPVEEIIRVRSLSPENRLQELLNSLINEENKELRSHVVHEVQKLVYELQNRIIQLQESQLTILDDIRKEFKIKSS